MSAHLVTVTPVVLRITGPEHAGPGYRAFYAPFDRMSTQGLEE